MFLSYNAVKSLFVAKPIIIRAIYAALQRNWCVVAISFAAPQGRRHTTDAGSRNCQVVLAVQALLLCGSGEPAGGGS
jgi:hypothetical protein